MHLLQCLLLATTGFVTLVSAGGPYNHTLIAEAGSLGTRVYLFNLVDDANGRAKVEMTDLGTGPPLTSFKDKPDDAADTIAEQLDKAMEVIPKDVQADVGVSLFGMAGMRAMDPHDRTPIYDALENSILAGSYPFGSYLGRTVSSREEGMCALIAANYLLNHTDIDLRVQDSDLMGVLDLRAASMMIAVPPKVGVGETLGWHLDASHMFVQSYLAYGEERIRKLVYDVMTTDEKVAHQDGNKYKPHNPCGFVGYKDPDNVWLGTGDATACQKNISDILKIEDRECLREKFKDCLPMKPVHSPEVHTDTAHFLLIEGFFSVVDFAQWWLEHPSSRLADRDTTKEITKVLAGKNTSSLTIAQLKTAAAMLCSETWDSMSASVNTSRQHRLTKLERVPNRCFDLNYIITLLDIGFGFSDDIQAFRFVEKVGGFDVDWSLGAFLLGRAQLASSNWTIDTSEPPKSWFWTNCLVAVLILTIIIAYARQGASSAGCLPSGDGVQMEKMA